MGELENIVLEMLNKGQKIDQIGEILKIEEDKLADVIINLDNDGFVILQDKQWSIAKKGKDIFQKREEDIKKLKIEYLHGDVNREEYDRRKKDLDDLSRIYFQKNDIIKIKDESIDNEPIDTIIDTMGKSQDESIDTIIDTMGKSQDESIDTIIDTMGKSQDESIDSVIVKPKIKDESIKGVESIEKTICPKCGIENKPGSNYCRKCGNILKKK